MLNHRGGYRPEGRRLGSPGRAEPQNRVTWQQVPRVTTRSACCHCGLVTDPLSVRDGETVGRTHRGLWSVYYGCIHASFESVRPADILLVPVTS